MMALDTEILFLEIHKQQHKKSWFSFYSYICKLGKNDGRNV